MSDKIKKLSDNSWLIEVQENGETKDLYIQLPPEALSQMGWHEDDTIQWFVEDSGVVTLKKKDSST